MRKSCLKPDKEFIEELCNKYGEDVRNAVTDAIISKKTKCRTIKTTNRICPKSIKKI